MYREERKERSRENVGENDGKNSPSLLKESCAAFFFLAKPLSVLGTRINAHRRTGAIPFTSVSEGANRELEQFVSLIFGTIC